MAKGALENTDLIRIVGCYDKREISSELFENKAFGFS